jgi:hypothetical protein
MSSNIFITYRREDTGSQAGRLHDQLGERYGPDAVFKDIDSIDPGRPWRQAVDDAVMSAEIVLAMIGPKWLRELKARSRSGGKDWVAYELEAALREGRRVIPLLVNGTQMPEAADLPETLVALTELQGFSVTDALWNAQMDELVRRLDRVVGPKATAAVPAVVDTPVAEAPVVETRAVETGAVETVRSRTGRIARLRESIDEPAHATRIYDDANVDLQELVTILSSYFRAEKMEVQTDTEADGRMVVQARHTGKGRKSLGVSTALTVMLRKQDRSLQVTIGASKWRKKVMGLGARRIGAVFLSPPLAASLMITAFYGAWKQTNLPKKTFEIIENHMNDRAT